MGAQTASSGAQRSVGGSIGSLSFKAASTSRDQQRSGGRIIRAPVDSDDEGAVARSSSYRTASYRVPDTDSDESDGEEVESVAQPWQGPPAHSPELDVLRWVEEEHKARYLAVSQRTVSALQRQLMAVDLDLAAELEEWEAASQAKQAEMVRRERERVQQRESEREQRLRQLSESQQQTALQQQQQLQRVQAQEEAARRAKQEAERKAAEEKRRKEEEEKRRKEEQQREEQKRRQAEEAQKQAAAQAAADKQKADKAAAAAKAATTASAAAKAASSAAAKSGLCVSSTAAEFAAQVARDSEVVVAAAERYKGGSGSAWRTLDKAMNKHVLQVSATLQQVSRKSHDLVAQLRSCSSDEQRAFGQLSLASKLLKQCEGQVQRLPSFAFPLAMLTVKVAVDVRSFGPVLLAQLHKACVLSVPKYFVYKKAADGSGTGADKDREYFQHMGYQEVEGEGGEKKMESTDQYIDRVKGYILFYAALTQVEHPANPFGMEHAWRFVACLLNSLPANRFTASVLDSFLKVAGYRMHQRFGRQFLKLMAVVERHFLQELQSKHDAQLSAVVSRVSTYLSLKQYMEEPEGMRMPQQDESEYNRA